MEAGAAKWIWENSRASNGSLIVLLAIADEIGEGESVEMKIGDLARKCRLSDKGVRRAVKDLESLGELSVESRPGGSSRYALSLTPVKMTGPTPVKMTGPQTDPGQNDRTPTPVKMTGPPGKPQVNRGPVKMTGVEKPNMLLTVTGSTLIQVKDVPAKPPRDDAERLCVHLADRIEANGCKRPEISKKWLDAARLLIDKDGRTEEQVHAAIDWCQDDEFWRANILSMPKLREKYDQLRMHAMRGRKSPRQQDDNLSVIRRFAERAAMEDGN